MRTEVKICGLKTPSTLKAALDGGADYVGLVFYRPSPRNVDIETAAQLAAEARGRAKVVALIVDAADTEIERIARTVRPDFFQAHGREDAERVRSIASATGIAVIKAVKVASEADVATARSFDRAAALVLFDAKAAESGPALPGGNGVPFDWRLIKRGGAPQAFMLSGGLTPENVAEAIAQTGAPIVDVSSGVESAPGIKDPRRILNFIEAARAPR
ncbi:MAG TPA: phosphoribosylanthranilate isomerase [Aestuariivirgaceae bacterium]|nr:phosphoribosylanthranilate isomerase [Aestuariivirgaceae bacterium]